MWKIFGESWEAYWLYRRIAYYLCAEAKAKAYWACTSGVVPAIYWLHIMLQRAADASPSRYSAHVKQAEKEARQKIVIMLEPSLKWLMQNKKVHLKFWEPNEGKMIDVSVTTFWGKTVTIDCLQFSDESLETIANCALHTIGELDLACKAFELRGLTISDENLLKYAQMCASELNMTECRKACALVKGITPLAAYQQCTGTTTMPIPQS